VAGCTATARFLAERCVLRLDSSGLFWPGLEATAGARFSAKCVGCRLRGSGGHRGVCFVRLGFRENGTTRLLQTSFLA